MHRQQLAIAASGIGYIIASLTGLALAPLPDLGSSPAHDHAYLATLHTAPFTAGSLLNLLAYLALLVFMVQLADLTSPRTGTRVRALAAAGATLAAACVASGIALAAAVALHRASLPPLIAATLLAAALATWILGRLGVEVPRDTSPGIRWVPASKATPPRPSASRSPRGQ
jgi:hypothetical protein